MKTSDSTLLDNIDTDTLGGQIPQYTPVYTSGNSSAYWSFRSTAAMIGAQSVPGIPADNIAIADTGTTPILVNDVLLDEIYIALGGTCSTTGLDGNPCIFPQNSEIPSITLYVGEYSVTLNTEDLIFEDYGDYYIGSVQSRTQANSQVDVFGDCFLRNIYAIFDFTSGNEQFGFVTRAPET